MSNFEYSHLVRTVNKSSHGISSNNRMAKSELNLCCIQLLIPFPFNSFFLRSQTHKIQCTGDNWTEFASRQNRQQKQHQNCQFTMSHGNDKSTCDAISEKIKSSAQDIHLRTECMQSYFWMYEWQLLWLPRRHVRSHTKFFFCLKSLIVFSLKIDFSSFSVQLSSSLLFCAVLCVFILNILKPGKNGKQKAKAESEESKISCVNDEKK